MIDNTMNNVGIFQVFMITWKVWLYVLLQLKVIILVKEIPAVLFIYGKHFKKREKNSISYASRYLFVTQSKGS